MAKLVATIFLCALAQRANAKCGDPDVVASRIVGGDEVVRHSIPWQAGLVNGNNQKHPWCGGTIIDSTHVLTAAHCTEGESAGNLRVLAGEHDTSKGDGDTRHKVKKIFNHEKYNGNTIDYDYAILELDCKDKIDLTDKARAACLPDPGDTAKFQHAQTMLTVSGWGDRQGTGSKNCNNCLHSVKVPFVDDKTCKSMLPGDITKRMICAGNTVEGGVDSCQGDSGGPLTWQDPSTGQWKVVGVVSWGYGCADKNNPGVYAEVQDQLQWIKNILNAAEVCEGEEPKPTEAPKPPTDAPKPPTEAPKPPTEAPKPPTEGPNPPTDSECGVADVGTNRIVGGDEVVRHSIPWQAGLGNKGAFATPWCGGTILDENHILTAAHCTEGESADDLQVWTGEHDISQADGDTRHNVVKIIDHPNYNSQTTNNDYSILVLDCAKPIDLTDKARAACLPEQNDRAKFEANVAATMFNVSGWGDKKNTGGDDDILHVVTVPFVNQETCQELYEDETITGNMICAGNTLEGGVDSCQGDSGGPMTWQDPDSGKWKVVGVVSWGYGCADKNFPGVYAEVEDVLPWIKENTKDKCDGTTPNPEPPVGNCNSGFEEFINDGYCDDENNNGDCQWDGGDCCFNTEEDWDVFCDDCLCLDPDVEMPCDANDKWPQAKCDKMLAQNKCGKKNVQKNCAETCKYCPPCEDLKPQKKCDQILSKGNCNKGFGKKNCRLTCGHCQPWN